MKGYRTDSSNNKTVILKLQVISFCTGKIVHNKIITDTRLIIEVVFMYVPL
jgi:hypothetical protein